MSCVRRSGFHEVILQGLRRDGPRASHPRSPGPDMIRASVAEACAVELRLHGRVDGGGGTHHLPQQHSRRRDVGWKLDQSFQRVHTHRRTRGKQTEQERTEKLKQSEARLPPSVDHSSTLRPGPLQPAPPARWWAALSLKHGERKRRDPGSVCTVTNWGQGRVILSEVRILSLRGQEERTSRKKHKNGEHLKSENITSA
jgi:hypothetical protein